MIRRLLAEMVLPGAERSVSLARHFVGLVLTQAGHQNVDGARLVASELVGNAVLHTRSARPAGLITVEITEIGDELARIEVIDEGALTVPRPRKPGEGDGTGRGLWLVEETAARWGVDHDPFGGNVVWAEVFTTEDGPDSRPDDSVRIPDVDVTVPADLRTTPPPAMTGRPRRLDPHVETS